MQRVRGRPPLYCSAACRQKAYRARVLKNPHVVPLRLLQSDLDRLAAKHRHVRALEQLGFNVALTPRASNVVPKKPHLRLVGAASRSVDQLKR